MNNNSSNTPTEASSGVDVSSNKTLPAHLLAGRIVSGSEVYGSKLLKKHSDLCHEMPIGVARSAFSPYVSAGRIVSGSEMYSSKLLKIRATSCVRTFSFQPKPTKSQSRSLSDFYFDRAPGRYRHHSDSSGAAAARVEQGQGTPPRTWDAKTTCEAFRSPSSRTPSTLTACIRS